jgi:hypothetical protein
VSEATDTNGARKKVSTVQYTCSLLQCIMQRPGTGRCRSIAWSDRARARTGYHSSMPHACASVYTSVLSCVVRVDDARNLRHGYRVVLFGHFGVFVGRRSACLLALTRSDRRRCRSTILRSSHTWPATPPSVRHPQI